MASQTRPNPCTQDWGPEELDFVYELNKVLRERVVSRANEEGIPPTQAFQKIRQEDLEDEREERDNLYRR